MAKLGISSKLSAEVDLWSCMVPAYYTQQSHVYLDTCVDCKWVTSCICLSR